MKRGYLRLGSMGGVPILVHWSAPVGAFVFTGFRFSVVSQLAFVGLVLVHELGHAFVARKRGSRVVRIEAHGLGGLCVTEDRSALDGACIAWGGVLAQAWLMFLAVVVGYVRPPTSGATLELWEMCTEMNGWMIAFNLLPFAPLDGVAAWSLFHHLGWFRRERPVAPLVEQKGAASQAQQLVTSALDDARRSARR